MKVKKKVSYEFDLGPGLGLFGEDGGNWELNTPGGLVKLNTKELREVHKALCEIFGKKAKEETQSPIAVVQTPQPVVPQIPTGPTLEQIEARNSRMKFGRAIDTGGLPGLENEFEIPG